MAITEPADPGVYGRSFAEVYDRWYPGGDEEAIVAFLASRLPPGASVLELGVGTGRVALKLAGSGFRVTGLDSSTEMLDQLGAKDRERSVTAVHGDAGADYEWPGCAPGSLDCVLAPCNLLLNLTGDGAQRRCVGSAARCLLPGGLFVVELSLLDPPEQTEQRIEVSNVNADAVVLIATECEPCSAMVTGNHIEVRDGVAVRLRPWSIRMLDVDQLDRWCRELDLEPTGRLADWSGSAPSPEDPVAVCTYRRR